MIPGKRINLWAVEKGDLLQNYIWANDPEIVKLTGMSPMPRTALDIDRWYETITANPGIMELAIKLNDGTYIGNVELSGIDWRSKCAEIGVMIADRKRRRQRLAREAVIMVSRFAFEEMGLHRIFAKVLSYNDAAQRLFESCGFAREGVNREAFLSWGKYWDVYNYSILSKEFFEKFPYEPLEENIAGPESPTPSTKPEEDK